jgi:hypothetical protein
MAEFFKQFVNSISSPVMLFTLSTGGLFLYVSFPKQSTSKWVSGPLAILSLCFFIFGLSDEHFRTIITMPDNVPIVAMLFIMAYFTWYALKKAAANDERLKEGKPPIEKEESDQKVLVFPYLIYIEFVVALFYAIGLVVWALYLKAPLEDPANPTISPNPSKAPWYFLGLQELLVYFDPWIAGVLLPTLIIVGLCALPYIDRNSKGSGYFSFAQRRPWVTGYLFCFWILWITLIIFGTFLRGPNWNFFGPFETWNVHKVVPLVNVNLSDYVFIKWMGVGLPESWFIREAVGFLLIGIFFFVPPVIAAFTFCKKAFESMGAVRYVVAAFLLLSIIAVPIKMYLRWAFNLKYIVAIPEFFFNI